MDEFAALAPDTHLDGQARLDRIMAAIAADPDLARLYEKIIADVPWPRLEAIVSKSGAQAGFEGRLKYLDFPFWLHHKLVIARQLGLHTAAPRRILDIGMGCGHFSYVCQRLGHEIVGVDVVDEFYREVCATLGVRRIVHRVNLRLPLPDVGRFDLITAFAAQFDLSEGRYWTVGEWRGVIQTMIDENLRPAGRIYFKLNPMWNAAKRRYEPRGHLRNVARAFKGSFTQDSVLDITKPR